jgi:hypothetical protein
LFGLIALSKFALVAGASRLVKYDCNWSTCVGLIGGIIPIGFDYLFAIGHLVGGRCVEIKISYGVYLHLIKPIL